MAALVRAAARALLVTTLVPAGISGDTPDQASVDFVDVTAAAGLHFVHSAGNDLADFYFVEQFPSGCAFLDYDGDGLLDLYLVNGAPLPGGFETPPVLRDALYRNRGDGTFEDVTRAAGLAREERYGMGIAVGDYDNDGDADIYLTSFGRDVLYRNNGDGTFSDVTAQAGVENRRWSSSAAFLDYDNDGDLDLYVANSFDYQLEGEPRDPWMTRGGVLYYGGSPDVLYRNDGDGGFTDVSDRARISNPEGRGLGVVAADFDDDGWIDVYVANDTVANSLYHNDGDGSFSDIAAQAGVAASGQGMAEAGMGTDAADFDGDGRTDLTVTNFAEETNTLWRNLGDHLFTDVTRSAGVAQATFVPLGFGIRFFDKDNDGDLDLMVTNGHVMPGIAWAKPTQTYEQEKVLLENVGDGTFVNLSRQHGAAFAQSRVGRGLAVGDYDNDGDQDVLVTNSNGRPDLLRNDGGNARNWLTLDPVGIRSNRDAIGLRVHVDTGGSPRARSLRAGGSYLSSHDLRLHVGLAQTGRLGRLELRWPSGVQQVFKNVPANRMLRIRESAAGLF